MDAQTQDSVRVSEKEQLTAPPGWTKKLVPASAKSITLRKYDVVFIAPDGQEVKSKWHLNRYLKAHPESPALSEFIWSSGEEAPIRRSTRFATKEASEDNKSTSRKKSKRSAAEMGAEEIENDQEKKPSRKRAKKAGKSAGSDEKSAVKDAADAQENDEVMHEGITYDDNEATQDTAPCDEVQKDESNDKNLVEVEASKEAVTEGATFEEMLEKQVKAIGSSAGGEYEDIQVKDEGLDKQVEAEKAIVSSEIIGGEDEEIHVKVIEVKESFTDDGLHAKNEHNAAQETGTLVDPADELKVEEVAVEYEVMDLEEHLDQKFEDNEDVSCKVPFVVEELAEGNDKPLEPLMQKEEPLEPLMRNEDPMEPLMEKEEQERLTQIQNSPFEVEHIKDNSPSEFSSSPVPVTVSNQ